MSQGKACREKVHHHDGRWVVIHRQCNYSAFSGGRRTPSAYNLVQCRACGAMWRTKAKFVNRLPDGAMR